MQRKKINDALPPNRREKIESSIDKLQLPMIRADAIGALHEATEAFALCKYKKLCITKLPQNVWVSFFLNCGVEIDY